MKLTKIIICFWFIQYLEILVSERAHVLWHDTIYRRNKKCRTYIYFSKIICFYDFHSPKKKNKQVRKEKSLYTKGSNVGKWDTNVTLSNSISVTLI